MKQVQRPKKPLTFLLSDCNRGSYSAEFASCAQDCKPEHRGGRLWDIP